MAAFLHGLRDSFRFVRVFQLYRKPDFGIQEPLRWCLFAHVCVFIGVVGTLDTLVLPLLEHGVSLDVAHGFEAVFQWLWFWPVHVLSKILCSFWYMDLAVALSGATKPAMQKMTRKQCPPVRLWIRHVAEEVIRIVTVAFFALQASLVFYWTQWDVLYIVQHAWLYSYYCFDYSWASRSMSLSTKLDRIQHHALYHLGFGLPWSWLFHGGWITTNRWRYITHGALFPLHLCMTFLIDRSNNNHDMVYIPFLWLPSKLIQFACRCWKRYCNGIAKNVVNGIAKNVVNKR